MSRISASGACDAELLDEVLHAALEQVVAEVHHERRRAQERLGGQHGVGKAGGLVLEDVGDLDAELRAVAGHLADLVAGLGAMMIPTSRMPASAIASMP